MPALKNDKFREYTRYAEYCLNMVVSTRDQELRCAQREMAAEWLEDGLLGKGGPSYQGSRTPPDTAGPPWRARRRGTVDCRRPMLTETRRPS